MERPKPGRTERTWLREHLPLPESRFHPPLESRSKSAATPACLPALPSLHKCVTAGTRFGRQAETGLRTAVLRHAGAPHFGVQARSHGRECKRRRILHLFLPCVAFCCWRNFSFNDRRTWGGTNSLIFPLCLAISRTILELRYVYFSFGIRKTVTKSSSCLRFINAI